MKSMRAADVLSEDDTRQLLMQLEQGHGDFREQVLRKS